MSGSSRKEQSLKSISEKISKLKKGAKNVIHGITGIPTVSHASSGSESESDSERERKTSRPASKIVSDSSGPSQRPQVTPRFKWWSSSPLSKGQQSQPRTTKKSPLTSRVMAQRIQDIYERKGMSLTAKTHSETLGPNSEPRVKHLPPMHSPCYNHHALTGYYDESFLDECQRTAERSGANLLTMHVDQGNAQSPTSTGAYIDNYPYWMWEKDKSQRGARINMRDAYERLSEGAPLTPHQPRPPHLDPYEDTYETMEGDDPYFLKQFVAANTVRSTVLIDEEVETLRTKKAGLTTPPRMLQWGSTPVKATYYTRRGLILRNVGSPYQPPDPDSVHSQVFPTSTATQGRRRLIGTNDLHQPSTPFAKVTETPYKRVGDYAVHKDYTYRTKKRPKKSVVETTPPSVVVDEEACSSSSDEVTKSSRRLRPRLTTIFNKDHR